MNMPGLLFSAVLLLNLTCRSACPAGEAAPQQPGKQEDVLPVLALRTDEVHITFHALDVLGRPATDLTSQDVKILDNGKPPLRVMSFEHVSNLPIRAGLIFDTSRSMGGEIGSDRNTARLYTSELLRIGMDRAFVMRFDFDQKILQEWTDVKANLLHGLDSVGNDYSSRIGGTKLYDSVYKACRDQWEERSVLATANFILLFTDGEDNASNAHFSEAIEMCQRRQVAIYVVTRKPKIGHDSGQHVLEELSRQTGGSLTFTKTDAEVAQALSAIRHTVDDRYTMVYKPRLVRRDGKFHKLTVDCLQHCSQIKAPSGYYAPQP